MKISMLKKINDVNELDNILNPKTTPVSLVKTMFKKTQGLSVVKLDTEENYGAMLYDSTRDKYMVFTDAKYSDSNPADNRMIHDVFKSLARDFQGIDKTLLENNRIKELKEFIAENEMIVNKGVDIDVPDLIISTDVGENVSVADDIGYATLAGSLFDKDLIHEDKKALSLNDFEEIISTAKGEVIGRITEIEATNENIQKENGNNLSGDGIGEEQEQENEQWQDIPMAR